jgi:hypothetical protein
MMTPFTVKGAPEAPAFGVSPWDFEVHDVSVSRMLSCGDKKYSNFAHRQLDHNQKDISERLSVQYTINL